jgi:hypothetical protein
MPDPDAVKVTQYRSRSSTAYTPVRRVLWRRMSIERTSCGETVPLVWPMGDDCTGCANHVTVPLLPRPLTARRTDGRRRAWGMAGSPAKGSWLTACWVEAAAVDEASPASGACAP